MKWIIESLALRGWIAGRDCGCQGKVVATTRKFGKGDKAVEGFEIVRMGHFHFVSSTSY